MFTQQIDYHESPNSPTSYKSQKKNKWTPDEDNLLKDAVQKYGSQNWGTLAKYVPGRTGKQCRERWLVGLDPSIKKDSWTKEEDDKLVELQEKFGNKWSKFIPYLSGRSSSAIKNRWSLLSRRSNHETNQFFKLEKTIFDIEKTNSLFKKGSIFFDGKSWEQLDYIQEESKSLFGLDALRVWFE